MKIKLFAIFFACIIYFLHQTSWFNQSPWEEATGYLKIPKEELPRSYSNPNLPDIKWLGHAGFIILWGDRYLLLDPNLSRTCRIIHRTSEPFINANNLPEVDVTLISHAHYDHLDLETLEKISVLKNIILPSGSEEYLSEKIILKSNIIGIIRGETVRIGELEIIQVPAIHNGARNHPFKSDHFATGYIIRDKETTLYYSGDTGYGNHFREIKERYSPDISILPIGAYEPYFVLKDYHLSPDDAIRAALVLKSDLVIPAHFGTFRVAFDQSDSALPRFAKLAREHGIVWQLKPKL